MANREWSRLEVEATVADYLAMLGKELVGVPYNKAEHRRKLATLLNGRSAQAIEFKHANISAALLDQGFPYISGYKPRSHYQDLLGDVVAERLVASKDLLDLAAADADQPMVVPEIEDILSIVTEAPHLTPVPTRVAEARLAGARLTTDYVEREARNRSLGLAGEEFILGYERARLIRAGCESLADRIEHTSQVKGDHEGFDILSFESDGTERLIEVKTTKYGKETPFFVSRNEVAVSEKNSPQYHVYRMFGFRTSPRFYTLQGAITASCELTAASFLAIPRAPSARY